jgi:hypothetical protein
MMARTFVFALLAASCAPNEPVANEVSGAPPAVTAPPSTIPEVAPVPTLEGEWRVAGIDGQSVDQPIGLALSASREEIWWAPRCAGYVRSYRIEGDKFTTGPHIGFVPRKPGESTPPVCAIAPPPRMGEVFEALTSATSIARTSQNGIEIAGGGHSLLLFSQ